MKSTYFLLIFIASIAACKKDQTIQPVPVAGTWIWEKTLRLSLPINGTNPQTPQNTGITESMYFSSNGSWKIVQGTTTIDSGTYSLGHGSYLPYVGAFHYTYDSVGFYKGGNFAGWDSYEIKGNSLVFSPELSARFTSFLLPNSGSKYFIRQ
jgi:hypothetical protein